MPTNEELLLILERFATDIDDRVKELKPEQIEVLLRTAREIETGILANIIWSGN